MHCLFVTISLLALIVCMHCLLYSHFITHILIIENEFLYINRISGSFITQLYPAPIIQIFNYILQKITLFNNN